MGTKLFYLSVLVFLSLPAPALAQEVDDTYVTGRVIAVLSETASEDLGISRTVQSLSVQSSDAIDPMIIENAVIAGQTNQRLLAAGDRIVLERLRKADGSVHYLVRDAYRLPALLWLSVGFLTLTVIFGRLIGATSMLGLGLSIAILLGFVMPLIAAGYDPLLVSLVGAVGIACTSLLLAHGLRRRTFVALLSTLLTLGISALLAIVAVWLSRLSGLGSEETVYLLSGKMAGIDLHGLLLGGIIIGCLGVLDDITTAQAAAVDEISRANPSLSRASVLRAGMSVGREHIASLTNTIALAYAGASFPLLLLLQAESRYPLWSTINSEFFAEEIVRTLVGSATLVLAVPISTWLAVRFLHGRHRQGERTDEIFHHHHHGHAL